METSVWMEVIRKVLDTLGCVIENRDFELCPKMKESEGLNMDVERRWKMGFATVQKSSCIYLIDEAET